VEKALRKKRRLGLVTIDSRFMLGLKFAQVIKDFKEGKYNVLVSTSIGEEGLDIGEVDIIVCYDSQKAAIRMVIANSLLLGAYGLKIVRFNE